MRLLCSLIVLNLAWLLPDNAHANPEEFHAKIERLEQQVRQDLNALPQAKGELIAITEYSIGRKTDEARQLLGAELARQQPDQDYLRLRLQQQLTFIRQSQDYLAKDIRRLERTLGKDQDVEQLLKIAGRDHELSQSFKTELQLLDWGTALGMDTGARRDELRSLLIDRADRFVSLVNYTQERLKLAIRDMHGAGKNVSAEQTEKVNELKGRLEQNSASLSTTIDLLDQLEADTTNLKQTLFTVSGDITQDVLNVDVFGNLLAQWLGAAEAQTVEKGPRVLFKLLVFVLIIFATSLAAKLIKRLIRKAVGNSKLKFSKLLQNFFVSLTVKTVYTLGILIALSQLGFELSPLLAGFGIAGVIIGFALQDTLSNFASGIMILIYRPFDVGDLITAAGVTGRVSFMNLVSTTVKTLDNQRLIIPNNKIWKDTINNITAERHRRVDMVFGISYRDNVEHAERVLTDIVKAHPKVLNEPEFTVRLHSLGESSVDFVVRPWVRPDDYWDVYWDITKAVKQRFDSEGISIPFPQRDVHFYRVPVNAPARANDQAAINHQAATGRE